MKTKYVLIVVGIVMAALLVTSSLRPHDTKAEIVRGKASIALIEEKFHRHRLEVTDIEYFSHRSLPEIEDWPDDCYKVTLSIPGKGVILYDYLDCNIARDKELLSGELTSFQNFSSLTMHPITLREIKLLEEYARYSKKPVESFNYEGNSPKNGIGVWSVYAPSHNKYYYFQYNGRDFKFLYSDHGYQ